MTVAAVFPLLDAFLTILWVFLFALWVWMVISVMLDIFRSHDIGGGAKALWFLFILFLPLVGVVVYLVWRGESMARRSPRRTTGYDQAYRRWGENQTGRHDLLVADELEKLAALRDRGVISEEQFQRQRDRLVGSP